MFHASGITPFFSAKPPLAREIIRVTLHEDGPTMLARLASGETVLEVGVVKQEMTRRRITILFRKIIAEAKAHRIRRLALDPFSLARPSPRLAPVEFGELMAVNFEMANFEFVRYKTPPKDEWKFIEEIHLFGPRARALQKGYLKGKLIGEAVNAARDLTNTPANTITPRQLAHEAMNAAKGLSVRVRILGKADMKRLKMDGVLAVTKGSAEPPRFLVLEYRGVSSRVPPIALVGKAVTFDSGGLNLKPAEGILPTSIMHMDMAGGAAVIHTLCLAARLKLKTNVIGIVPAAENMPSGTSYHPGDIITMMDGTTVEIINTDGEGRLLLADALTYAAQFDPRLVVDVATLTGAAVMTLGFRASALFTRHERLAKIIESLGEDSGDYVWRLPLWEEYETDIKGTYADLANAQKGKGAGAIAGAIFLQHFAKGFSAWAHLDIAPRIIAAEDEYLAKGSPGAPVRLLIKLLEQYK